MRRQPRRTSASVGVEILKALHAAGARGLTMNEWCRDTGCKDNAIKPWRDEFEAQGLVIAGQASRERAGRFGRPAVLYFLSPAWGGPAR